MAGETVMMVMIKTMTQPVLSLSLSAERRRTLSNVLLYFRSLSLSVYLTLFSWFFSLFVSRTLELISFDCISWKLSLIKLSVKVISIGEVSDSSNCREKGERSLCVCVYVLEVTHWEHFVSQRRQKESKKVESDWRKQMKCQMKHTDAYRTRNAALLESKCTSSSNTQDDEWEASSA